MGAAAGRSLTPGEVLQAYVGAFVDELGRAGVRHVCLSPGSRSAPLALTFRRHGRFRVWTHLDERSAAFFALGIAKALREPVGLVCTSGTAAANFLPAVVEAFYAGVPLVVMTADRPAELRGTGATQTIDQQLDRIYRLAQTGSRPAPSPRSEAVGVPVAGPKPRVTSPTAR